MSAPGTSDIRNVAVVGHGHCGKTSLVEALLFHAGATKRLGSTDQGNSVTDYGEDEQEKKTSIRLGLAHFSEGETKVNLIDTPGFAAFLNDARVGLSVADTAVVVIDAVSGVEVQTERVWSHASDVGTTARVFVVNKLDRENADFDRAVASITEACGREAVPVQVPVGSEGSFRGVVDLVSRKAYVSPADGSAAVEVTDAPDEVAEAVDKYREALVEMVAESDEALMEKFLEEGDLTAEDFGQGLARAVAAGLVYPVTCASAVKMVGIRTLAELLASSAPPPTARPSMKSADGESERKCSDDEPTSLQVFKTLLDPFAGRLSLFRVMSGVVSSEETYHNVTRNQDERAAALCTLVGKDQEKTGKLHSGDLGCLSKLKETLTGDTLTDKTAPIEYAPLETPAPMISFALEAKNQGDEEKITSALSKIAEEDLMLRHRFDPQTKELVVSGSGDKHVEAVVERLKQRFKVEVVLHPPRVPYLETITKAASGSYRHKKQTGGAGQFAEVHMEIKPLQRGGGFEYDTGRIFGGSISSNFFPSIEKGLRQVLVNGPVAGAPVVDIRCEVFDGKMHPVDSKDIAFQIAGRQLMRQLMLEARPIVLEPIMQVTVFCPEECMGDVMGDLSSRRGRVQGMEAAGGRQTIRAQVPLAELLSYQATLKSVTGGRGDFTMELEHYDQVPGNIQEQIVAEAKKTATEDEDA